MPVCEKCQAEPLVGDYYISGGERHFLCMLCSSCFKEGMQSFALFLLSDDEIGKNLITKRMIKARRRRAKGKSPWALL